MFTWSWNICRKTCDIKNVTWLSKVTLFKAFVTNIQSQKPQGLKPMMVNNEHNPNMWLKKNCWQQLHVEKPRVQIYTRQKTHKGAQLNEQNIET
jgi:hypothetical protein